MSVMIVLLPVVYLGPIVVGAAAAAMKAHEERSSQGATLNVETRMKDLRLLTQSFTNLGFSVTAEEQQVLAKSDSTAIVFFKNSEGLWVSQFSPNISETSAREVLINLDREYGKLVQQELISKIRQRSSAANLALISEQKNSDESVTITLAQVTA